MAKREKRLSSATLGRLKKRVKRVADRRNRDLVRKLAPEQAGSKTKESGRTVWRGASLLTGEPVRVVVSGYVIPSENTKMGYGAESLQDHQQYIQIWIFTDTADFRPMDRAICGDCGQRTYKGKSAPFLWEDGAELMEDVQGACYVRWSEGPRAAFEASNRNGELTLEAGSQLLADRLVRIGAAGDPAAVPAHVWHTLLKGCKSFTAYTHQWNRPEFQALKAFCMASTDSRAEEKLALAMGWSCFTADGNGDSMGKECLNNSHNLSCAECRACDGMHRRSKPVAYKVAIHGALSKRFRIREGIV
mgnify:FL=1|jgi:hypothetical protein